MNQERFDWLARGLATNRLSRWQVLKTFGAVAALGFLETLSPLRTPFAVAAASCPNKNCTVDPEQKNNLCMSCTEAETYIESTGVKGASGKTYPTWAGVTEAKWDAKQKGRPAVKGPYRCSCKKGGKKNQWCYKGTYKSEASVKNEDREIRWVPNPPVPKRCKTKCDKAIEAWCKKVDAHEQHHMRENNKIVKEANKGNAKFADLTPTFVGCANTKAGAKNEMQKKAQEYYAGGPNGKNPLPLWKKLDDESQKRGDAFHHTPAGEKTPPPCDSCEKCGCGSTGVPCPPDKPDCCNGQCVDTDSDSTNCGACGSGCATGQTCDQGNCVNGNGQNGKCGANGNLTCPPNRPFCCKNSNSLWYNDCIGECSPGFRRNYSTCECVTDCSTNDNGDTKQCHHPWHNYDFCCPPDTVCCPTPPESAGAPGGHYAYPWSCCYPGYTCCPGGGCWDTCPE